MLKCFTGFSVQIISINGVKYTCHNNVCLLFLAKGLINLWIVKKRLNCCTSFSVQNISINGFKLYFTLQRFFLFLCKTIVKTMHFYEKCLTLALVLVFKIFLIISFKHTLHYNVLLLFSPKGLLKLCIVKRNA